MEEKSEKPEEKNEGKPEEKNEDIEYCQDCLNGKCEEHYWFGKPKTENEILINTLKMVTDVLPLIIERVYLVETALRGRKEDEGIFFADGQIDFIIEGTASHKKDGYEYYIPLDSYVANVEGVVDFYIQIEAIITRHNPMSIEIYKDMLCEAPIHSIDLIREDDFLHYEEIGDYIEIVNLAKDRLNQYIDLWLKGIKKELI